MSDRLAKQVADKLRAIDEWGSRGDVMSVRNALPALAELVEAVTCDCCCGGVGCDQSKIQREALRRVAESLGVSAPGAPPADTKENT